MVQVDLITGFLGAGKTTFLRRYVAYLTAQGHHVCILENDFGAVNVDAMLVQDLHNQATIQETLTQFDRIIQGFVMITMPNAPQSAEGVSLMATGLNGYVTHIIIRWVSEGFKQPLEDVLAACCEVFQSFIETTAKKNYSRFTVL